MRPYHLPSFLGGRMFGNSSNCSEYRMFVFWKFLRDNAVEMLGPADPFARFSCLKAPVQ